MLGFGHDSGVVRIGVLDAFPVFVNGIFPVLVLAVDLAGFIAGSVRLRAFRRPAVALAAGEGMDGEAPAVRGNRHMGCSRHHRVSSRHVVAGTRAVLAAETGPQEAGGNIVKIALTLVGGVGAVAYLVIKYQERQQAGRAEKREKDRTIDTKVQDAINQLGSDKASTRIAGVYALTDIADRYKDSYRQRVVDILCGYLRSDRSSYAPDRSRQPVWDASGHFVESVASDEAVESTILSVMHDRLRKERKDETGETIVRQTVDDDQLWCACTFDLHEATFHEAVDLTDSTFECVPCFRGTKFERRANFGGAHFAGYADFRGAHFAGYADFGGAHFAGGAVFVDATFARYADFSRATFTGDAYFGWATFARGADFVEATFARGADFGGAEFRASAAFLGIQGQPSLGFKECKFNEISRGAYEWGPIPIPEDNDGLPAGAMWKDFLKEDDKDGGTTNR